MSVTSTLSANQDLALGSLAITTDPAGASVPYTVSTAEDGSGVLRLTVPDATKAVISCSALITTYSTGTGSLPNVSSGVLVSNQASLQGTGLEAEAKKTIPLLMDSASDAIAAFKLVSADSEDIRTRLAGKQFRITASANASKFSEQDGRTITLTTDENGVILLDGSQYIFDIGAVYEYTVEEIQPDAGYDETAPITFSLTKVINSVDHANNVYYYTESLFILHTRFEPAVTVTAGGTLTTYKNLADAAGAWNQAGAGAVLTLLKDVVTDSTVTVSGGTEDAPMVLDLNGHTLDRGLTGKTAVSDGSVLTLAETSFLTIQDSSDGADGVITGGNTTGSGGGILNNSSLTINGGSISGNYAAENGGGICNNWNVTMRGGTVSDTAADLSGFII